MSTKLALIFSSFILLIIIVGIIISLFLNKKEDKPPTSPSEPSKLTKLSPQYTSQNFPAENSRRATQNIAIQLSKSSSINPYISSNDNSY